MWKNLFYKIYLVHISYIGYQEISTFKYREYFK